MKTIEVSVDLAERIEIEKVLSLQNIMINEVGVFIDVSSVDTPLNEKHFIHNMTGKKLIIRAEWLD